MAEQRELWAPFTLLKSGASSDGIPTRTVYGQVSDSSIDIDLQNADPDWLKSALAEWWPWGNIQANHNGPDVGVGVELTKDADAWMLTSEIVDPLAIAKVDKGVYKGYSIGIRWPKLAYKNAQAKNGTIVGGKIVHVALCGRPANDGSRLLSAKSAATATDSEFILAKSPFADVEAETIEEAEQLIKAAAAFPGAKCPFCAGPAKDKADPKDCSCEKDCGAGKCPKATPDDANKAASVNTADRKELAAKGQALNDGSYPIPDVEHLKSAITLAQSGHGNVDAAKRLIKKRARQLGAEDQIPDSWKAATSETSQSEMTDAQLAGQAAEIVKQLIAREASEAAGSDDDDDLNDVQTLTSVLNGLRYFMSGELSESAMLLQAGKMAIAELNKAGARNSSADQTLIQTIHDHAGSLGASASDGCRSNAGDDGDDDMDEKSVQAEIEKWAEAHLSKAVAASVEEAMTAAGVTAESLKSAQAQSTAEVAELVKGAVTPLDERLRQVEERAEDGGAMIMAVQRGLAQSQMSSEKAAVAAEVSEHWHRAQTHQDPTVRAQAVLEFSRAKARFEALERQG